MCVSAQTTRFTEFDASYSAFTIRLYSENRLPEEGALPCPASAFSAPFTAAFSEREASRPSARTSFSKNPEKSVTHLFRMQAVGGKAKFRTMWNQTPGRREENRIRLKIERPEFPKKCKKRLCKRFFSFSVFFSKASGSGIRKDRLFRCRNA